MRLRDKLVGLLREREEITRLASDYSAMYRNRVLYTGDIATRKHAEAEIYDFVCGHLDGLRRLETPSPQVLTSVVIELLDARPLEGNVWGMIPSRHAATGWHPSVRERLESLLGPFEAQARALLAEDADEAA